MKVYRRRSFVKIRIRQCKYLNNIVEQDHRFIKRRVGQGYRDFESARRSIARIEMVHMIKKGQMGSNCLSAYKAFYSLAV
ncbi:DDE-type integrase/transposase/recombinase [Gaetbulibacter sp. M235]|uniref:DDE-type integrase/transposase/recombinase n=1 Tax=Gaetbulibacter sp. M235 TaxID=3126510 RepID=UPI00374F2E64